MVLTGKKVSSVDKKNDLVGKSSRMYLLLYFAKKFFNEHRLDYKNSLKWAYLIFLLFTVFYVRQVLNTDYVTVEDKKKSEKVEEVKDVDVSLFYEGPAGNRNYKVKMKNIDSVEDLISTLRDEQEFMYEKTVYRDHVIFDEVLGYPALEGYYWAVIDSSNTDITNEISDTNLGKNKLYTVKLLRTK